MRYIQTPAATVFIFYFKLASIYMLSVDNKIIMSTGVLKHKFISNILDTRLHALNSLILYGGVSFGVSSSQKPESMFNLSGQMFT